MTADPRTLDNESLAKMLDEEGLRRPVYNGDMAPVMREAARRLRELPGDRIGKWDHAKPLEACPHCHRREPIEICPMGGCPMGGDF